MLYYRRKQPDKYEALRRSIEAVMLKHPGYGHKRVADDLQISRKRAQRAMKLYGLKPARRARAPNKPHDMGQPESNRPDILSKLSPMAPDTVWVADFAYIWFHTDLGSEYRSYALTKVLEQHGIQASPSPKSSLWRNITAHRGRYSKDLKSSSETLRGPHRCMS